MKTSLALIAFIALVACKSAMVPTAAENECRTKHHLQVGTSEYADCVAKLSNSEAELRKAN